MQDRLHHLLEVVQRDLGADDARVELGGRDPSAPGIVHVPLPGPHTIGARRLVAVFDDPARAGTSEAERDGIRQRLRTLASSFVETAHGADEGLTPGPPSHRVRERRLDLELTALADRAGATVAVVVDQRSPVLWGAAPRDRLPADAREAELVAQLVAAARASGVDLTPGTLATAQGALNDSDDHRDALAILSERWGTAQVEPEPYLTTCEAIDAARREEEVAASRYLGRAFAQLYRLVLVFNADYSQLRAEGSMIRAIPGIERLVMGMPPVDPSPGGAKVVRLPPRLK